MNETGMVLAVIEPEINPQQVADRALWLAGVTGSALELLLCDIDDAVHGDTVFVSNEARDIAARIRAAQQVFVDELASPARKLGVAVTTRVLDERPIADGVIYAALDRDPLFVVKGTRHHSDAQRADRIDADLRLIRRCPAPLWIVKRHTVASQPTIIATVDPTQDEPELVKLDQSVIDHAKGIAGKSGGELHLLHIYQPMRGIGAAAIRAFKPIRLAGDEVRERIGKEHREKLDALAAANHIDQKHTHQLPGQPRDILPYFAIQKNADVVVMGAIAHSGRKRTVAGNAAEKVVDHVPCDILLLRKDS